MSYKVFTLGYVVEKAAQNDTFRGNKNRKLSYSKNSSIHI